MRRNWREIAFTVGYHLIGVLFLLTLLGVLVMDLFYWRAG